jgi:hypothetical protein
MGAATKECAPSRTSASRSNKRLDIVGIDGERAIEEAACLRHIFRDHTLIEPSQTLKIKVHRVGVRGFLRPPHLRCDKLCVQRPRKARYNLVLHVKEVGNGLFEALCPEMITRLGVDKLDVDAHAICAPLHAALERVAHVEVAADLRTSAALPL